MIVCMDRVTLRKYAVKETLLDGQFSIFAQEDGKKGWKRVRRASIWTSPFEAARGLIEFQQKDPYKRWWYTVTDTGEINGMLNREPDAAELLPF